MTHELVIGKGSGWLHECFFLKLNYTFQQGIILAWKHGKCLVFEYQNCQTFFFWVHHDPKSIKVGRFFGGLGFSTDSFCTSYLRCFLVANIREDGPLANDPRWTWQGFLVSGNCGNCQQYWMLLVEYKLERWSCNITNRFWKLVIFLNLCIPVWRHIFFCQNLTARTPSSQQSFFVSKDRVSGYMCTWQFFVTFLGESWLPTGESKGHGGWITWYTATKKLCWFVQSSASSCLQVPTRVVSELPSPPSSVWTCGWQWH